MSTMTLTLGIQRTDLAHANRCAHIIGTTFRNAFKGRQPVVAVITDFGTGDSATYGVRSAIRRVAPNAQIDDIDHGVPLNNILVGAARLREAATSAVEAEGTVYVAVVDPGVGTDRKAIIVQTKTGKYFVGPNNGVLSLAVGQEGIERIVGIENEELTFLRLARSGTFHGRDLFAPVAGHLARGVPLNEFGPSLSRTEFAEIKERVVVEDKIGRRSGQIIQVDGVHALRTNVPNHIPERWVGRTAEVLVEIGERRITTQAVVSKAFDQKPGTPLVVPASTGCIDFVICNGHADKVYKIRAGDLGLDSQLYPNNRISITVN